MVNRRALRHALPCATIAALWLVADPATQAATSVIANGSAEIYVGAGSSNFSVDTVRFQVPGANVGDGTPVQGLENGVQASVLIDAQARAPLRNSRTAIWTVDSSQPLRCATPATCGATAIPMSKLRWSVTDGNEIADGRFSDSPNQPLATFLNSRYVYVFKRFFFVNDEVYPAGTYTGRVVYTLSMP